MLGQGLGGVVVMKRSCQLEWSLQQQSKCFMVKFSICLVLPLIIQQLKRHVHLSALI